MELDDLKKSWKTMDEKLQSKQLATDDDLLKIIQNKKNSARKSQRSLVNINLIGMILAILLILFVLAQDNEDLILGKAYWWTLIVFVFVGIPWNIYTIRYLHKTDILVMPLATVINRINRYNYWMTIERVAGAAIIFIFALISIVKLQAWRLDGWLPYFIYGIWILAFAIYFFFANKITFRRLKNIRRNLDELKEVNNETNYEN